MVDLTTTLIGKGKIWLASLAIALMPFMSAYTKVYAEGKTGKTEKPVIIQVKNVQESSLDYYVYHSFAKEGMGVVFEMGSSLCKDPSLVEKLRDLYEHNPNSISFSVKDSSQDSNNSNSSQKGAKSMEKEMYRLSEKQREFTKAFNLSETNYFGNYNLIATTLSLSKADMKTVKAARQAAFKVITSDSKIDGGYKICDNGVMLISNDTEGKIDYKGKVKSIDELIAAVENNLNAKDPFLITIDNRALTEKYGTAAEEYLRELKNKLKELQKKENINFMTFKEFYTKHSNCPSINIMLRLDDYHALWGKELSEEVINSIAEMEIPQTIGVIPESLHKSKCALAYLKSLTQKYPVELAIHGFNHKGAEFDEGLIEQIRTLKKSAKEFKPLDTEVYSIAPPGNKINSDTSLAIEKFSGECCSKKSKNNKGKVNIKIISANLSGDDRLFGVDERGVYHISRTIDVVEKWEPPYIFKSKEKILSEIGNDDAVLMVHPLLYKTEENRDNLKKLLLELKQEKDVEFKTLYDFYKAVMPDKE